MTEATDPLYSQDYFEYLHNRSPVRRWIRTFYLKDITQYCIGKCIDFGCGTGELMKILPDGSIGFEINPVAVAFCRSQGLDVAVYDPELDDYSFNMIPSNTYSTFTMNHVLEHIEDAHQVIRKIFKNCSRLGVQRIVFTVPGIAGYRSDATHRTFIDGKYMEAHDLTTEQEYKLTHSKYFPFNHENVGRFFTHNELRFIFDRRT
ncbi:MAG: class I SAM-dependent methyltransferase [Bacteroidota bacterium]|nr:class I SAM-dependent methyltransferase [Bacteroidota bacterium]